MCDLEDGVSEMHQLSSDAICGRPNEMHDQDLSFAPANRMVQRCFAVRPSAYRSQQELVRAIYTVLEVTHRTVIHSHESSNELRYAIRTRFVCMDSLHDRLGVVLETAMIALMHDG